MKRCTANGVSDAEDYCWLDRNRPDLCWIENRPNKKEDCEYWEEVEEDDINQSSYRAESMD